MSETFTYCPDDDHEYIYVGTDGPLGHGQIDAADALAAIDALKEKP